MKKFLKAVALATVMCMLLSVSAFAAEVDGVTVNTLTETKATDSIAVEVVADKGEEVALLVVTKDASLASLTDAQIEYIGQVTANADTGVADFGSFTVKSENPVVDIYVGSASFATARKIGSGIDLTDVKKITIVGDVAWAAATGDAGDKSGVAAAVNLTLPEGVNVSKMIWAFTVEGEDFKKYSKFIENPTSGTVSGSAQFAFAYQNGSVKGGVETYEITDVDVIILDNNGEEYFTDADDAQREDSVVNPAN